MTYTNVAVNSESEWSDSTTYTVGDLVQVTDQTPHRVYKSLRGNNTDKYPPDNVDPQTIESASSTSNTVGTGAKTFTVATGLGFVAGMVVNIAKSSTPLSVNMTAEITSYNSGTGALGVSVYSSKGDGTHAAWTITSEDEIGFWKLVESTNQYKMFDEYVNTKTVNLNLISVKLNVQRADNIALFGLTGNKVTVALWDATETTKYWEEAVDLTYGAAIVQQISDWYEYFFGEYSVKEEVSLRSIVSTYNGVLTIDIAAETGTNAECGNVVVGRGLGIGKLQHGVKAGIIDFSQKETDDIGRTSITPGYWAKTNNMNVFVENIVVDAVYRKISSLRGIPTAWIGDETDGMEMLLVFGLFKDFSITVSGPFHSWCDLEIEGLI